MIRPYNPDKYPHQSGWRAYQDYLQRNNRPPRRRLRLKRIHWMAVGLIVLVSAAIGINLLAGDHEPPTPRMAAVTPVEAVQDSARPNRLLDKANVHILLGHSRLINLETQPVEVTFDGRTYEVNTSLDMVLQSYLLKKMDRVNSRYIGIVAMDPDTGQLLAMAGFNKIDPDHDPCLAADYPAASLFKIVTAAAAVEEKGYTAGSRMKFNGYKHTLYKRQLTDKTNRYTNSISFRDSFAQSVNPVFGKIGALYLDRDALEAYGSAFAFNREVTFELPWSTSLLAVKDEPYHRAEIASGFNRQTTISPLHGAVLVSAIVNDGRPVEPTLVDRIVDPSGNAVYRSKPRFLPAAISPDTADVLDQLMTATVKSGTAKKVFRGHNRNKVLSRLTLGGKTGSIFNRSHDARFDWYVGYAAEKKGSQKLVVSVMVAHEEYIGIRAGQYARMTIEHFYKDYFNRQAQSAADTSG